MRLMTLSAIGISFLAVGMAANAQGRRPTSPQPQAGAQRSFPSQLERSSPAADVQRQAAEVRRAQAEARRAEAQARRQAAAANNNSEEARAAHPPNEHAADEAFLAEQNADARDSRSARRELRRENRRNEQN